ncbi:MAG: DNA polymerase I [Oscillospiraceae bacterium]|jgi:DNA polymerase-1|nr:DNA polymerase I [Oscillospiraceae bacterium]
MKLLAIDGNSILNRAFYGIKPLATKDGRFTNGIVGFLNIFLGALGSVEPDAVAVAFDMKQPTFRHKLFADYKAGRKEMPAELAEQFPVLKEILRALGYAVVECPGFEADDILGTLAAVCGEGDECYISTGDRDSLQLIRENVRVLYASTKMGKPVTVEYDEAKVLEEYSVTPAQLIDVKALMGDSSDNIPGVAGIGQKTASTLVAQYRSLEEIYADVDALSVSAGVKEKLKKGRESAFLSRELGIISKEALIERSLSAYARQAPDMEQVQKLLTDLEMYKMLERLDMKLASVPAKAQEASLAVVFRDDYTVLAERLRGDGKAFFTLAEQGGNIVFVCFCFEKQVAVCDTANLLFAPFWHAFLEDGQIEKYTENAKALFAYGEKQGVAVRGVVMDTLLAGYLINPNASDYSVVNQAAHYNIAAPGAVALPEGADELLRPAALAAAFLPQLSEKLRGELAQNQQTELLAQVEIPLAKVLAAMEHDGFMVDAAGIAEFGKALDRHIEALTNSIYAHAGAEFNIQSPKQLGDILFEKMKLPKGKKTKTGYSTNAEVLEGLVDAHPVVGEILSYRTLAKLKSTYCDGLLKVVGPDGRIHSTFNQAETRTGRISSTEPNLQNIPVRQDLGRELRRFFTAREGYVLVDADYSQIELRVLAHIADDPVMIETFNRNEDIHTITASQVFSMPPEMVTPLMRSRAKAVNFGIVYGIGAFSLAKDIGVSRYEADQYIKAYLHHYAGVSHYMDAVIAKAKADGFVETLYHRRRYLPELAASNAVQRAFGERVARNMPIQGTAADIIKIAMVNVFERLRAEKLDVRLILQVHDELILEAVQKDAQAAADILKQEMEHAARLNVKLVVDVHVGKTWYDAKG